MLKIDSDGVQDGGLLGGGWMRLAPAPSQEDDSIDVKKRAQFLFTYFGEGMCEVSRRRLVFDTEKSTKIKCDLEKGSAENVFQAAVCFYSRGLRVHAGTL